MGIRGITAAVVATACLCIQSAHAADTRDVNSDAIIKAITKANIVAPGYTLNAVIFPSSHEVVVSTYTNAASKDVITDCKVDALLIARKVIETSSQTVRVKVRFYDLNQTSYREVVVTKPDISAFATGAVKKEELLNSLEVTTINGAGKTAEENTTRAQAAQPAARVGAGLQPTDKFSVMRKNGLMFYYPKAWGAKDMSSPYGDFIELTNNQISWASIICRLQDKDSAEQTASDEDKYYWSSHQHVQIQAPKTVLIGYSKNIQALVYYIKDNSNPADPDRYEKHVYFGYKHRIYSLSVRFSKKDFEKVNADLNAILNTIVRE
ncbi:hypothetical protein BH10CYA1_BH10CYA1_28680 [soil metagenome]